MSNALDEQLSAFLDGELPGAELALLLKQLEREPARRQQLARYALIGEYVRATDRRQPAPSSIADRVSAALAAEAPSARRRLRALADRGWFAAAAAAAVTAVAVVVAWPLVTREENPAFTAVDDEVAELPLARVQAAATRRLDPRAAARLQNYLVAHGEYAGGLAISTFDSHLVAARVERAAWQLPAGAGEQR